MPDGTVHIWPMHELHHPVDCYCCPEVQQYDRENDTAVFKHRAKEEAN